MRGKGIVILTALLCCLLAGCRRHQPLDTIVQVSYSSNAGPILPELQWYEEITITPDAVLLTRSGRVAETEINTGSWQLTVDPAAVSALFEHLAAVDCTTITRLEPDDPLDGGETESYRVVYASGAACSLRYDPGTTYANGMQIVQPVRMFLAGLDFPANSGRYR